MQDRGSKRCRFEHPSSSTTGPSSASLLVSSSEIKDPSSSTTGLSSASLLLSSPEIKASLSKTPVSSSPSLLVSTSSVIRNACLSAESVIPMSLNSSSSDGASQICNIYASSSATPGSSSPSLLVSTSSVIRNAASSAESVIPTFLNPSSSNGASQICNLYDSALQVNNTNSGLEATLPLIKPDSSKSVLNTPYINRMKIVAEKLSMQSRVRRFKRLKVNRVYPSDTHMSEAFKKRKRNLLDDDRQNLPLKKAKFQRSLDMAEVGHRIQLIGIAIQEAARRRTGPMDLEEQEEFLDIVDSVVEEVVSPHPIQVVTATAHPIEESIEDGEDSVSEIEQLVGNLSVQSED